MAARLKKKQRVNLEPPRPMAARLIDELIISGRLIRLARQISVPTDKDLSKH